jgi:poly-gamma-glutamate synthesis protein (capsule biosynthesis protein)
MVTKQKSITLTAVGDVIIARRDYQSSFTKVADILKESDIAFFNCETAYAESGSPGMAQHGATPHDPKKMPALLTAGFDVCTCANNHTMDWGVDAVIECRQRLEAMGIAVCGTGSNSDEARKPAIVERKGIKVAFLGYCSTGPEGVLAEEDKPGAAMVRIHTLFEPIEYQPGTPPRIFTWANKDDLQKMVEDIKKAKQQADVVVMTDHWGLHHTPIVIPEYEYEVSRAAIDAGADLVLGTHPHILKAIEVYKGKVIIHSLANFALEGSVARREGEVRRMSLKSWSRIENESCGPRSPDDKKTLIVKCVISKKGIERVSYIPVMMDADYALPEPLPRRDPRAEEVFKYVDDISRAVGINTKFSWDGDEVVIHT